MSVNDQENIVIDPEDESVTTGTETGTDGTGTETGTDGAEAGVKFADVYGSPVSSSKLSQEAWAEREGYDIEGDFKNAAADLEYEYKTHLSTYGANAEKLYQMGLSNAGVSDIYGANAYSAYLSAMNDLNLEKIEQQRELKRLYSQYATNYDDTLNADATEAYNYILSNNLWNGANADVVKNLLLNQGYGDEAVYEAMRRLDAVDPSWLQNQRVMAAYNSVQQSYLGPESAEHVKSLLSAAGYTDHEINAAMTLLESGYNASKAADDKATFEANKPLAIQYALKNYNGTNKQTVLDYIKAMYGDEMVAHVDSVLSGLSPETLTYLSDQTVLSAAEKYSSQYVGNEESENSIKEKMRMNGMNEAQINAAMEIIKSTYDANPDVIAAKEQETINEMLYQYGPAYNPASSEAIMQDMGIKDRNLALKIIRQLDENFRKNVAAGYNACKEMYNDGASIDQIKNDLEVSGYSKWEINEIVKRLGMNGGAIRTQNVKEAYSYIISNNLYNGKNIENIKTQLENLGYDAEVADEVVTMLSKLDMSEYQNQDVFDAYTSISDMYKDIGYNGSDAQKKYIRDVLGLVYDEDTIDRAIKLMDSGKAVTDEYEAGQQELTDDQIKADGVNAVKNLFYDAEGNYVYDGSETAKASIRQRLRGSDYEKYTDEIIAQMDADLAELKGAAAEDYADAIVSDNQATLESLSQSLINANNQWTSGSEDHNNIKTTIQEKSAGLVKEIATNIYMDPNKALSLLGVSAEDVTFTSASGKDVSWNQATDDEKRYAVMSVLAEYCKEGVISGDAFKEYIEKCIPNEISYSDSIGEVLDTVMVYKDMKSQGYLNSDQYDSIFNTISKYITFTVGRIPSKSQVVIKATSGDTITLQTDSTGISVSDKEIKENGLNGDCLLSYGGKLYVYSHVEKSMRQVIGGKNVDWSTELKGLVLKDAKTFTAFNQTTEGVTTETRTDPTNITGGTKEVIILPDGTEIKKPEDYKNPYGFN